MRFRFRCAKRPNNCSSGYLLAFIGAGFTSVATILAFSDLGELVAFFLAIVEREFAELTDDEVARIEVTYAEAFSG